MLYPPIGCYCGVHRPERNKTQSGKKKKKKEPETLVKKGHIFIFPFLFSFVVFLLLGLSPWISPSNNTANISTSMRNHQRQQHWIHRNPNLTMPTPPPTPITNSCSSSSTTTARPPKLIHGATLHRRRRRWRSSRSSAGRWRMESGARTAGPCITIRCIFQWRVIKPRFSLGYELFNLFL